MIAGALKMSLIATLVASGPLSMDATDNQDPSNDVGKISSQAKDSEVELLQSAVREVPVANSNLATNGDGDSSGSGVSVAAADPEATMRYITNCIITPIAQTAAGAPITHCEPTTPASAPTPAPIVLTSHDVATLIIDGSGITLQPPGGTILLHMPLIAYTNPTTRTLTTTVGTTTIDVEVTPTTYTWNWGDGTTTTTTDPGHPYPNHTTTHQYTTTANNITITLTTTWTARYKPTNTTTWQPVTGYVTTTQTTPPQTIRRLIPYLTDDTEEHQNH